MFVRMLVRQYPDAAFMASAEEKYRGAFSGEPNLHFKEPVSISSPVIKTLSRYAGLVTESLIYDASVKIGGSVFMQAVGSSGSDRQHPRLLYRIINRNRFYIGANFGPYFTEDFLQGARISFGTCRGVSLRDRYSADLFRDIPSVQYAPDLLFGYPDYPRKETGRGVGISVIAPEGKQFVDRFAEAYYDGMAQLCDALTEAGEPVKLLAFCEAEGDMEATGRIRSRMRHPEMTEVAAYQGNIDGFLGVINSCRSIVASRFHGMILGFALGKCVLPVIYSQKQAHVLRDLEFGGNVWNLLEGQFPSVEDMAAWCRENPVLMGIDQLASEARNHFSQLSSCLNEN